MHQGQGTDQDLFLLAQALDHSQSSAMCSLLGVSWADTSPVLQPLGDVVLPNLQISNTSSLFQLRAALGLSGSGSKLNTTSSWPQLPVSSCTQQSSRKSSSCAMPHLSPARSCSPSRDRAKAQPRLAQGRCGWNGAPGALPERGAGAPGWQMYPAALCHRLGPWHDN